MLLLSFGVVGLMLAVLSWVFMRFVGFDLRSVARFVGWVLASCGCFAVDGLVLICILVYFVWIVSWFEL